MPPDTRYAKSGDVNIAYQVVGEGPFDLVYVPGWISNIELMWEEPAHAHLLQRLAAFSRLILFDKRGTGLSDPVSLDRMNSQIDVREVLPTIQAPTLVLQRVDDRDVNVEEGRWIAQQIPGAKYVELPGDEHLIWAGDVDAVVDEVEEFLTGARPVHDTDRVLATVLFTDIVGSTERATELGDRKWSSVMEQHNALVRRELERFRGREVDTAGDGFLATFDGPARAIRCACAVRDAVRSLGLQI